MKTSVVICGIGGQGNILASGLMGAALVEKGYKVTVGETYGASQRGGSVMSHLKVSDDKERGVLIPEGKADIVVAFEPVEALRILRVYGNENTKVIYDTRPQYPLGVLIGEDAYPAMEDIEAEIDSCSSVRIPLPATEMAIEAGNAKVANILMMGALAALDEMPMEPEDFFTVLDQNFKGKALELNKKVFMIGYDRIKEGTGVIVSDGTAAPAKAPKPVAEAPAYSGVTQKCRFSHPLRKETIELELPVEITFKEIMENLQADGFIEEKKGGYQFIFEDHMCTLAAPLADYIPEGVECMDIRIHGLLVVLT